MTTIDKLLLCAGRFLLGYWRGGWYALRKNMSRLWLYQGTDRLFWAMILGWALLIIGAAGEVLGYQLPAHRIPRDPSLAPTIQVPDGAVSVIFVMADGRVVTHQLSVRPVPAPFQWRCGPGRCLPLKSTATQKCPVANCRCDDCRCHDPKTRLPSCRCDKVKE